MARHVSIMGATGSVGRSALAFIAHANAVADEPVFSIGALSANRDVARLAQQAIAFDADLAVIADESRYDDLKAALSGTGIKAASGAQALAEAASRPADRVLAGIVGIAGLHSTHDALAAGNSVALANKESMVCAGPLLKRLSKETGAAIVPTDSEHNAMFQVMERAEDVEKLLLTASGGPFLNTPLGTLHDVTPDQACKHPRWSMGRKISVDSASFMNKALELVEAAYLFDMPEDRIDVVVHPQSIVHSLVAYRDGSVLAQMGSPDMQTPIAHALSWPDRRQPTEVARLDLKALARLDFMDVDDERFPAIGLARAALQAGGASPLLMNCANEVAVSAFLEGKCRFTDISWIVSEVLDSTAAQDLQASVSTLDDVIALDREGRRISEDLVKQAAGRMGSEVK